MAGWIELMLVVLPMIVGKEATAEGSGRQVLSRAVVPEHYDLDVKLLETGFCGSVGIRVEAEQGVSEIVLNAKGLEVRDAGVVVGEVRIDGEVVCGEAEQAQEVVRIKLGQEVRGSGYVVASFCGSYGDGLVGLYKSGGEKEVYCTHFEPTDARRMFPCFDQPDMKATFRISVDAPSRLVVLSNGRAVEEQREEYGDRSIEYFEETRKMSTYLVAIVAGELEYIEDWSSSGVRLRVYGSSDEVGWGRYGLEVAKRCLDYFAEYFGVGYEFPSKSGAKIDMVGIPNFGNGAMENWGLVTFRKESLLYVAGRSSVEDKKNVSETVCHELAHMWFGNLVTMSWWDDLWLNEGFATWMSFKGLEQLGDAVDWDVWGEFVEWNVVRGMGDDGLGESHGIRVEVRSGEEINEIFDSISYSKGASVIRMIERYVGEAVFKRAIQRYISQHMYGNASGHDLWRAIGDEYGQDISGMVEGWISQAGYPIVRVQDSGEFLTLTQSRYSMVGKESGATWDVPVVIWWSGAGTEKIELGREAQRVAKRSEVYKVNAGYGGFYRVLYDEAGLRGLEGSIDSLSTADRVNVVEDVFGAGFGLYGGLCSGLAKAGLYYADGYNVGRSVLEKLLRVRSVFYDDAEVVELVSERIRSLIGPRVARMDVRALGGSVEEVSMNKYVLSVGIEIGDAEAIGKAVGLWEQHVSSGVELGELRGAVYKAVVDSALGCMMERYERGSTPGERREVMLGLGAMRKRESFDKVVEGLGQLHVEDVGVVIASICRGSAFRDEMVSYVVGHGQELYRMVQGNGMLYNTIILALRHVSSDEMASKVWRFLDGVRDAGSSLSVQKVRDEIEWRRRMKGARDEVVSGLRGGACQ